MSLSTLWAALTAETIPAARTESLPTGAPGSSATLSMPGAAPAPAQPAVAWRRVLVIAVGMWLVTRVIFAIFTYFAVLTVGKHGGLPANTLLDSWDQWDTVWYVRIAQSGYATPATTAFFPLYPMLTGAVAILLGGAHQLFAALLVSNLAALGVFFGVGLLAASVDGTEESVRHTIRVAAAFPFAFFLTAAYSESMFIALAVFALVFARQGRWYGAALCAFLAGLTRSAAVVLILPLLWEYGSQHQWWRRETWAEPGAWRRALSIPTIRELAALLGAVPLAIGLYLGFLWRRFGDPLIFLKVEDAVWHRQSWPLWRTVPTAIAYPFTQPPFSFEQASAFIDLGVVLGCVLLIVAMVRRLPFSLTLYTIGVVYFAVATPAAWYNYIVSARRYVLPAAPIYLLLGRWSARRPWLDFLLISGGFLLQGIFAYAFLHGDWAG